MKHMDVVRSRITSVFLSPRKEEGDEKRRRVNTKNLKAFHERTTFLQLLCQALS